LNFFEVDSIVRLGEPHRHLSDSVPFDVIGPDRAADRERAYEVHMDVFADLGMDLVLLEVALARFINANEAAIIADQHVVPLQFEGAPFQAGSVFNELVSWTAPGGSRSAPRSASPLRPGPCDQHRTNRLVQADHVVDTAAHPEHRQTCRISRVASSASRRCAPRRSPPSGTRRDSRRPVSDGAAGRRRLRPSAVGKLDLSAVMLTLLAAQSLSAARNVG
jgi:hypothetical protein